MQKILKKPLFYAPFIMVFIGIPSVLWLIIVFIEGSLDQGFQYRNWFIQAKNLKISWNLNIASDSVFINSPKLKLLSGPLQLIESSTLFPLFYSISISDCAP
jgi:hypothetical protein